ncbi:MAG: hypothetical protein ACLU3G_01320 [Christensenellales bacterium]
MDKCDCVQLFDDHIIVEARQNAKKMFFAMLAISPLCLVNWALVWIGLADPNDPKVASYFLIAFFAFELFQIAVEAGTTFRFDRNGATETVFKKVVFIPWSEMKYIGACDSPSTVYHSRYEMLFSKIPYSEFKKYHTMLYRMRESRYLIRLKYIDDETYEKILEFAGGERNIE